MENGGKVVGNIDNMIKDMRNHLRDHQEQMNKDYYGKIDIKELNNNKS